ncbi:hypothetical protein BdWA1_003035 [Babesia duncani]|uniref:Uncharacterized protein n=1 Tax=Babesia duncani TaxID=323732 RepID=A0AAD9PI99_9APIC|nr:hypothetical protein BdWA1_003035 [Babesia duncani]
MSQNHPLDTKKILYIALLREHLSFNSGRHEPLLLKLERNLLNSPNSSINSPVIVNGAVENQQPRTPEASENHESVPKSLYGDLNWAPVCEYYWPVKVGDSSPLSPDGEALERRGKIGLDFWHWERDSAPLGYTPPLCTCKRPDIFKATLSAYVTGESTIENLVCDDNVCKGLLYIPYSLLEVSLNRVVCNAIEFAQKCNVPDNTDIYCGSMKHTIVLCTHDAEHERECLEAISASNLGAPLVFQVNKTNFIPFFKPVNTSKTAPIIAIDSRNPMGIGEMFAILKKIHLEIYKFNMATKQLQAIDPELLDNWSDGLNSLYKYTTVPNVSPDDYVVYELTESFSWDRRPLEFTRKHF